MRPSVERPDDKIATDVAGDRMYKWLTRGALIDYLCRPAPRLDADRGCSEGLIRTQWRVLTCLAQFDVTARQVLLELQACRECSHKHSIFQCGYSVDFDDVTFVGGIVGEFVLHENHRRLPR